MESRGLQRRMLFAGLVQVALAGPGSPAWTSEELAVLEDGRSVYRHWRDVQGGQHGVGAIVVGAPEQAVWGHILDLDSYVEYLPYVTASELLSEDGERYDGRIAVTTLGLTTTYELDHARHPGDSYATFVMTPVGSSPVEAATGWWKVSEWVGGRVLVEYAIDVDLDWYVPSFFQRKAARRGLPVLLTWIKLRSEAPG
jgi:ribosome-associated toxin RatA of RatAB toxin-antitoxin module